MPALWIVKHLDVGKHILPCFVSGFVDLRRMRADAQTLRNIINRITAFGYLLDGIQLELFGEIGLAHNDLLALIKWDKVSTNLGAIQFFVRPLIFISLSE